MPLQSLTARSCVFEPLLLVQLHLRFGTGQRKGGQGQGKTNLTTNLTEAAAPGHHPHAS